MAKKNEWTNKNVHLKLLSLKICEFLQSDNFSEIKLIEDPNGVLHKIRARKKGILKTMTGRRKAFHIIIDGTPNEFKVALKGEMGKNYLYGGLVGVGLNARYQKKLWKFIQNTVNLLENSNNNSNPILPPKSSLDNIQYLGNKQKSKQEEALSAPNETQKLRESSDDAISILQKRLATGDIDKNEYYELLNILQSSQKYDFNSVTIKHNANDETSFWTCPTCSGPIEEQQGRQYCRKCDTFL